MPRYYTRPGAPRDRLTDTSYCDMFKFMSLKRAVLIGTGVWVVVITGLHAWLNLELFGRQEPQGRTFKVGFLPVT